MKRKIRTLLILGRVSNVPTVWSNCLAGWMLGGGGSATKFLVLCFGGSCLYVGGMFLNDAFDADFDRQHRKTRPIPSGAASEREVWSWGLALLAAGVVSLAFFDWKTTGLVALTVAFILLYDALHKSVGFAFILMALCRFFLFLVASSSASHGAGGLALWSASALGIYVAALSYVARGESTGGIRNYWPAWFLVSPIAVAMLVNTGAPFVPRVLLSLLLGAWILQSLRGILWSKPRQIERAISGLIAGIVFVDLLAVAGGSPPLAAIFLGLFISSLLLQRFVPAT